MDYGVNSLVLSAMFDSGIHACDVYQSISLLSQNPQFSPLLSKSGCQDIKVLE